MQVILNGKINPYILRERRILLNYQSDPKWRRRRRVVEVVLVVIIIYVVALVKREGGERGWGE